MRRELAVLSLLVGSIASAQAQLNVGIGVGPPGVSIGINLPVFPDLEPVPGYPVYYDPRGDSNYFFYDGMYWVYQGDNWYSSSWFNGPWSQVDVNDVPLFVLRVPVRYYRQPPAYFRGWGADAPPRWGEHWGNTWEQGHRGWDHWDRNAKSAPAPLPLYQRQHSGDRYPRADQQREIQSQNYHYQPHEAIVQQRFNQQPGAPVRSAADRPAQSRPGTTLPSDQRAFRPPPRTGATQVSARAADSRSEDVARQQRLLAARNDQSMAHQSQPPQRMASPPPEQQNRQAAPVAQPREPDIRQSQRSVVGPREPQVQGRGEDRGRTEQREGGRDR